MSKKHKLVEDQAEQIETCLPEVKTEPWVETERSTIMDAFIYLTRNTETKSGLRPRRGMKLDTTINDALLYLMRRLDMTSMQVYILACAIFHGQASGQSCDADDLTEYMDIHPLKLFSQQADFDKLIELGYLELSESHFGSDEWSVRKEAVQALTNNQPFDIETLRSPDASSFLGACASVIRDGRRHDNDGEIEKKVKWLFNLNRHLSIVQNIKRIA